MICVFFDLENMDNPANGREVSTAEGVGALFDKLRHQKPFICELESENGYRLQMGLSAAVGCAQFAYADSVPPYWMAIGDGSIKGDHLFYMGGQETEISERYCLSYETVKAIAVHFVENGAQFPTVSWEDI